MYYLKKAIEISASHKLNLPLSRALMLKVSEYEKNFRL